MKRIHAQRCGSSIVHYLNSDLSPSKGTRCGRKVLPGRWGVYEGNARSMAAAGVELCADCKRYEQSDREAMSKPHSLLALCSSCGRRGIFVSGRRRPAWCRCPKGKMGPYVAQPGVISRLRFDRPTKTKKGRR